MSRAIITCYEPGSFFVPLWERYYQPFFYESWMIKIGKWDNDFQSVTEEINRTIPDLLLRHSMIMIADIDEIVVPDPEKWKDLGDYLDNISEPTIRCTGYNVVEMLGEKPLNLHRKITNQRKYWLRDELYDKPVITKRAMGFGIGQHTSNVPSVRDDGLVMFHLRDADIQRSLERRKLSDSLDAWHNFSERQNSAVLIPDKWRVI